MNQFDKNKIQLGNWIFFNNKGHIIRGFTNVERGTILVSSNQCERSFVYSREVHGTSSTETTWKTTSYTIDYDNLIEGKIYQWIYLNEVKDFYFSELEQIVEQIRTEIN